MGAFSMIGTTVSHYEILEKIGQGGMGEVFLADNLCLGRKGAFKFLPEDMQQDAASIIPISAISTRWGITHEPTD